MPGNNGVTFSMELRVFKRQVIYVIATSILLLAISMLEAPLMRRLEPLVPTWMLEQVLLAIFVGLTLVLAYLVASLIAKMGNLVVAAIAAKPKFKPLLPLARALFVAASLIAFLIVSLRVLAYRITSAAGVVEWLIQAFSGFFSLLIALIVAMQVREIVGNYLAWIVIKAADLVEPGDYVSFGSEVLRVVKVGYSHTIVVNNLNEEIYIPNLRFLLEAFRKSFSRTTRRFIDVRFTLPYSYALEKVREGVAKAIDRYSERYDSVGVAEYRLLISELSSFTVTYELWVRPAKPVFPMLVRSGVMAELLKEFGENLSVPMLLKVVEGKPLEKIQEKPGSESSA